VENGARVRGIFLSLAISENNFALDLAGYNGEWLSRYRRTLSALWSSAAAAVIFMVSKELISRCPGVAMALSPPSLCLPVYSREQLLSAAPDAWTPSLIAVVGRSVLWAGNLD